MVDKKDISGLLICQPLRAFYCIKYGIFSILEIVDLNIYQASVACSMFENINDKITVSTIYMASISYIISH